MDNFGILTIVGRDHMKRQIILLIKDEYILFRQISTFNIKGILIIDMKNGI